MNLEIRVEDYISQEEIKSIAEEELRDAFRAQFRSEADVERVLTNLTHEFIFKLIEEQWDGDFEEELRNEIKRCINEKTIQYAVFRRRNEWERTESPAVKILDEECANSRPLIKAAVEKHIAEYPFHELDRDEIGCVIYDTIMGKLFPPKED